MPLNSALLVYKEAVGLNWNWTCLFPVRGTQGGCEFSAGLAEGPWTERPPHRWAPGHQCARREWSAGAPLPASHSGRPRGCLGRWSGECRCSRDLPCNRRDPASSSWPGGGRRGSQSGSPHRLWTWAGLGVTATASTWGLKGLNLKELNSELFQIIVPAYLLQWYEGLPFVRSHSWGRCFGTAHTCHKNSASTPE